MTYQHSGTALILVKRAIRQERFCVTPVGKALGTEILLYIVSSQLLAENLFDIMSSLDQARS